MACQLIVKARLTTLGTFVNAETNLNVSQMCCVAFAAVYEYFWYRVAEHLWPQKQWNILGNDNLLQCSLCNTLYPVIQGTHFSQNFSICENL